jgi:hypothetical protein
MFGSLSNMSNTTYNDRHGGPYDRGAADSYYGRPFDPHYFVDRTYSSPRVNLADMTPQEIVEYTAGYNDNEKSGNKKDWD